jgi:colanic acid biosynthesis glycosyl transferase WcaI
LRVLVVSQVFWPESFRINDLAVELSVRGHDVTVLTGVPNYPEGRVFHEFAKNPRAFSALKGVEIVRVPIVTRGSSRLRLLLNYLTFAVSAATIGAWKLRGRRFEAIFVFEPSPVTVGIPAVVLRAIKEAPIAFWVLDLWPETLEAVGAVRSPFGLRMVGRLVSFIYARCDLILAQSKSFIPSIAKYCKPNARIAYFPSWAAEVPLLPGAFNVMFAGNIGVAQDFPTILAAAEQLKDRRGIRWLVVGDGRMGDWVREEIARRGLQDTVLMLGRYPVERMPSFYAHADALLVSLRDEPIFAMTIPGKLQSYLAAGIPVIAMLNGEGAAVVERHRCGLTCRAGDADGLAAAVLKLAASSAEERMRMGENGRRGSEQEFDRTRLMTQLETWLAELLVGLRESHRAS